MKITLQILACFFLLIFQFAQTFAVQKYSGKEKFYDIVELGRFLKSATESGFSGQDLKKLELRQGHSKVNVTAYILDVLEESVEKAKNKNTFSQEELDALKLQGKNETIRVTELLAELNDPEIGQSRLQQIINNKQPTIKGILKLISEIERQILTKKETTAKLNQKKYLTIRDIFNSLSTDERAKLKTYREDIIDKEK